MRAEQLHDVIATDIPQRASTEAAPLEMDDDIGRHDAWMFAPLIAATVALPILATALLGVSAWHIVSKETSLSAPPSSFAMRWPDREMPLVVVR